MKKIKAKITSMNYSILEGDFKWTLITTVSL